VCEYGLAVSDGTNPANVIPVADRLPLLQTWVKSKHCLQSHVGKTLGAADEVSTRSFQCNQSNDVLCAVGVNEM